MAQAARLNLRLQKELKLLLTDPPPGASFPFLSAHSDLTSLSTIHAQIEGPEGTVYAKGVFDIKIQIPERYPFQPPSVTFATPIYHPNIDNGGRICLDILNLPPKGAWQPSLNISTILTSIGLLLSEPNPDDGLMCEASREYKYNRQAFDQKARSMTEKHAKAGASWNNCDAKSGLQKNLNSSVAEFRGSESRLEVSELASSHNNPCAISRKLSLEFSSSSQNRDSDVEANEMGSNGKRKELNINIDDRNLRHEKLCRTRGKLSLESSCQIQKRDDHDKENVVSNHSLLCIPDTVSATSSGSSSLQPSSFCQKNSELKNVSIKMSSKQPWQLNQEKQLGSYPKASCGAPSMSLSSSCNEQEHPNDSISSMGNGSSEVNFKKVPPFCKGSSQAEEKDNKENMLPIWRQTLSSAQRSSTTSRIERKLSLGSVTQSQASNENNSQILSLNNNLSDASTSLPLKIEKKEPSDQDYVEKATVVAQPLKTAESPLSEAVVVLDSEDSEEERDGILRSKLMLRRKRIGKCRARA